MEIFKTSVLLFVADHCMFYTAASEQLAADSRLDITPKLCLMVFLFHFLSSWVPNLWLKQTAATEPS